MVETEQNKIQFIQVGSLSEKKIHVKDQTNYEI